MGKESAEQKNKLEEEQAKMIDKLVKLKHFSNLGLPANTSGTSGNVPPVMVHQFTVEAALPTKLVNKATAKHENELDRILDSEELLAAFKKFLKTELSLENLEFVLAVNAVETYSPSKQQTMLKNIHDHYIQGDAEYSVNLPSALRANCQAKSINRQDKKVEPKFELEAYKKAAENIRKLMEHDSLPRFLIKQEELRVKQAKPSSVKPKR